ncbi:MAG: CHAT domain-containing protein [Planctomycetia bacterium]|nr:CHAT domain-containing protein [Planctomycetia bacterium]
MAIYEKTLGPDSVEAAQDLHNLATQYSTLGDVQTALSYCERALAIREKALGPEHRHTAITLDTLAGIRSDQGNYEEARSLYERALAVFEKTVGPQNYQTAQSLLNVAKLTAAFGEYAKALQLYQRSLAIHENVLGPEHPNTAHALVAVGTFYRSQGDYESALPLYQRALAIHEKVLGEDSHYTATSLDALAGLYCEQGDFRAALPLSLRALRIFEKVDGAEHRQTADCLAQLARISKAQGNTASAVRLYKRALSIDEKLLGRNNPTTAATLAKLAEVHHDSDDYAAALPLLQLAMKIAPNGETASKLARCYQAQGNYWSALPLAQRALAESRRHLDEVAFAQSERQQLNSQRLFRVRLDTFLSTAAMSSLEADLVYDPVLAWKGATFARQRWMRAMRHAQRDDPATSQLYAQIESKSRLLANATSATPSQEQLAVHRDGLERLAGEIESLQQQLAVSSNEFRGTRDAARVTAADLKRVLPEGVALVDLVEYDHYGPLNEKDKKASMHRRLMGFVVRADREIKRLDLGPADRLYPTVTTWRVANLHFEIFLDEVEPAKKLVAAWRKTHGAAALPESKLREWVWDKLAPHLDGCNTVLVSPDGALSRFPWAALPGKKPGHYLIEELALAVIPVPQLLPELLAEPRAGGPRSPALLVVGDVDFTADPGRPEVPAEDGPDQPPPDQPLRHVAPLPGTKLEALTIGNLFKKTTPEGKLKNLRGKEPTEQAVRDVAPHSTYVHLATHGYFDRRAVETATRRINPDLLCGVTLVGAGHAVEAGKDDGLLTALEVKALDLEQVDLVTLSACQTALGVQMGAEGVLSLQRAFQVAGVRTTVTTLWSVSTDATSTLMVDFYDNLWRKKLPRVEALRQAQLKMLRDGPKLRIKGFEKLVDPKKPMPPFFWAGFILSGDWR